MNKKRLFIIINFIAVFFLLSLTAFAYEYGIFKYSVIAGEAMITGCDKSASGVVVIPRLIDGYRVTDINTDAFEDCDEITEITIPRSVERISAGCFSFCDKLKRLNVSSVSHWMKLRAGGNYDVFNDVDELYVNGKLLTSLVIPDDVTEVRDNCFNGYTKLEEVTVHSGVKNIKYSAFAGCTSLKSIKFEGDTLETIGSYAFQNCSSLSEIQLPSNLNKIEHSAFEGCTMLKSINIPDTLTKINSYVFCDCSSLSSITIPANIELIDNNAFEGCTSLESINFSKNGNLQRLGNFAFQNCTSLKTVEIPDSVKILNGFNGCTSLETVIIGENNSLSSIGSFEGCKSLKSFTVPDGVINIGTYAFRGCTSLKSISLPLSLKSVYSDAFVNCTALETVSFPNLDAWYQIAFSGETSNPLYYSAKLMINGKAVTELNVPDTLVEIPKYVFAGYDHLTSVTLTENTTKINDRAFAECNNLQKIIIPSRSAEIAVYALPKGCPIYGYVGSTVESFALERGYTFVFLDERVYAVKFDANGGENAPKDAYKGLGTPYVLPDMIPTRAHCSFAGWSTSPDGKVEYLPNGQYTKEENLILYAQWIVPSLVASDIYALPDGRFDITVELWNNPGISKLELTVSCPSFVKLTGALKGNALKTHTIELDAEAGSVILEGKDSFVESGSVVTLTFETKNAVLGSYPIDISVNAFDHNGQRVELTSVKPSVKVASYVAGDIDGNGRVELKDVTELRRYLAGASDVNVTEPTLDVNRDGEVSLKDVTTLRRYLAGGYGVELN